MENLLRKLDGYKTLILAIVVAVNNLLVAMNVYDSSVGATISTLAAALLGGAKLYGNKLGVGKV